jgi:hypothetical protein
MRINGDIYIADTSTTLSTIANGIIIEQGTGYIKYSNGIMICYGISAYNQVPASTGALVNVTLPKSYKDTNYIALANMRDAGSYYSYIQYKIRVINTNTIVVDQWNNNAYTTGDIRYQYMTIGFWK